MVNPRISPRNAVRPAVEGAAQASGCFERGFCGPARGETEPEMIAGDELRLRPDEAAPAMARGWLDRFSEEISSEKLEDARLVVDELVSNSVRHANLSVEHGRVTLRLVVRRGMLEGSVCDTGEGFEVVRPPRPREDMSGGWGLPIVERLCSRWDTSRQDGLFCVWFEMSL